MKRFLPQKNLLLGIALVALGLQSFFVKTKALDMVGREELNFDDKLTEEGEATLYTLNSNILITPVFFPSGENINSDEWIEGLYYYSVQRLGYVDIPFHYAVDTEGKIYKTNGAGEEAKVDVADAQENSIIVAYLANEGDTDFTDKAKSSFNSLLLQVANENSIEASHIQISNLRFLLNRETKVAQLESREITGTWQASYKSIKNYVNSKYSPVKKKYRIEVIEAKSPTDKLTPGATAIIELTIKNVGEHTLFADSEAMLLATKKDGKLSKFFLNSVWASQSQISIMSEGDLLRPSEEKTFQMKFKVPLYFGIQKENFIIKDGAGNTIAESDFSVEINVGPISETVIEILTTDTGYLNVRASDSGNAKVINKVSPGERFIQKKTSENGYVQIDLGEGELGWVSQKYVKRVN